MSNTSRLRVVSMLMLLPLFPFPGKALHRLSKTPVLHSVLDKQAHPHALLPANPGSHGFSGQAALFFFDDPKAKPQPDPKRQQRTALGLTITGGGFTLLGGAILISAANESPDTDGDALLAVQTIGVLALIAGLCMLIPGIVRLTRL